MERSPIRSRRSLRKQPSTSARTAGGSPRAGRSSRVDPSGRRPACRKRHPRGKVAFRTASRKHASERPHVAALVCHAALCLLGLMYAAVPRMSPAPVITSGDVTVGEFSRLGPLEVVAPVALARPKSRTFTCRLRSARCSTASGRGGRCLSRAPLRAPPHLPRDGERLVDWQRPLRDARGQRLAVDQLEDEKLVAVRLVEVVDSPDVRVVEGSRICASRRNLATRSPSRQSCREGP